MPEERRSSGETGINVRPGISISPAMSNQLHPSHVQDFLDEGAAIRDLLSRRFKRPLEPANKFCPTSVPRQFFDEHQASVRRLYLLSIGKPPLAADYRTIQRFPGSSHSAHHSRPASEISSTPTLNGPDHEKNRGRHSFWRLSSLRKHGKSRTPSGSAASQRVASHPNNSGDSAWLRPDRSSGDVTPATSTSRENEQAKHDAETFVNAIIKNERASNDDVVAKWLAILLYIGIRPDSIAWRNFVGHCLGHDEYSKSPEEAICDRLLPITSFEGVERYLGVEEPLISMFYRHQWLFCPQVFQNLKELSDAGASNVLDHHRRLPYETVTMIGEGSFGNVAAVSIDSQHWHGGNGSKTLYARKEVKLNPNKPSNEATFALHLHRSTQAHECVLKTLCYFKTDTIATFLMDLAECNLDEFMNNANNDYGESLEEKKILFDKIVLSVDAVRFLHHGCDSSTELSFFHLDLKPENILVFRTGQGKHEFVYKVADFSISAVAYQERADHRHSQDEHIEDSTSYGSSSASSVYTRVEDLRKLYQPRNITDPALSIRIGDGAMCLPPEALGSAGHIGHKCDVWGLGSVITLYSAWLLGGHEAYQELRENLKHGNRPISIPRNTNCDSDNYYPDEYYEPRTQQFFERSLVEPSAETSDDSNAFIAVLPRASTQENDVHLLCELNSKIEAFMKRKCDRIEKPRERSLHRQTWTIMKTQALVPNPKKRTSIKALHESLQGIASQLDGRQTRPTPSPSRRDGAGSSAGANKQAGERRGDGSQFDRNRGHGTQNDSGKGDENGWKRGQGGTSQDVAPKDSLSVDAERSLPTGATQPIDRASPEQVLPVRNSSMLSSTNPDQGRARITSSMHVSPSRGSPLFERSPNYKLQSSKETPSPPQMAFRHHNEGSPRFHAGIAMPSIPRSSEQPSDRGLELIPETEQPSESESSTLRSISSIRSRMDHWKDVLKIGPRRTQTQ